MKIAVIGLGSMGKRRARNLKALGVDAVLGWDPREDRRVEAAQHQIAVVPDVYTLFASRPDAVVISTPPDLHVFYGLQAVDAQLPFFTEASVPDPQLGELIARMRSTGVLGMPSCTMRFYPGPKRIISLMKAGTIGRPYAWTYHSGQYLPDWHPWEPIESFYVSRRATGACREIVPFEFVWLIAAFGPVDVVACQKDKVSDIGADIDDIYQLQVRHQTGILGQLTVEVLARSAVRQFRVIGAEGLAEWDSAVRRFRMYRAEERRWVEEDFDVGTVQPGYIHAEEPYIEEMREFLRCLRTGQTPAYTFEDDRAVLDVLLAAERSASDGTVVHLRHASPVGVRE